jgi:hypothetical protein
MAVRHSSLRFFPPYLSTRIGNILTFPFLQFLFQTEEDIILSQDISEYEDRPECISLLIVSLKFLTEKRGKVLLNHIYARNIGLCSSTQQDSGSSMVKELCYKPEGRGFDTLWGEWIFLIYRTLLAALGPRVHSSSNRNEYQKQKNVSGEYSAAGA